MSNDGYFEVKKVKNPISGYIIPLLMGLFYSIMLGALQYYLSYSLYFLAFLSSYLIGKYMLKYLEYYTLFHKILAAIYALICYIAFIYSFIFFYNLPLGFLEAVKYIFSIRGLFSAFLLTSGFNLIFLIITPISAFAYIEYYSRRGL